MEKPNCEIVKLLTVLYSRSFGVEQEYNPIATRITREQEANFNTCMKYNNEFSGKLSHKVESKNKSGWELRSFILWKLLYFEFLTGNLPGLFVPGLPKIKTSLERDVINFTLI